jgi:hypothetical protein
LLQNQNPKPRPRYLNTLSSQANRHNSFQQQAAAAAAAAAPVAPPADAPSAAAVPSTPAAAPAASSNLAPGVTPMKNAELMTQAQRKDCLKSMRDIAHR